MYRLQKHKSEIRKIYRKKKEKKKKKIPTAPLLFALGNVPNSHQTAGVILAGLKTLSLLEELNPDLSKKSFKITEKPIWLKSIKVTVKHSKVRKSEI